MKTNSEPPQGDPKSQALENHTFSKERVIKKSLLSLLKHVHTNNLLQIILNKKNPKNILNTF
jgi:hypothetical protein